MADDLTGSAQQLYELVTSQGSIKDVRAVLAAHTIDLPDNTTTILYSGELVDGYNARRLATDLATSLNNSETANGAVSIIVNSGDTILN